jgi:hypothetical protein
MAYVDPGSGTLLWQALLAGAVGGVFYFRRALVTFGAWITGKTRRQEREDRSTPVDE